ncbi:EntF family bacteriocin induction factor [Holzapfeliella saturejae]
MEKLTKEELLKITGGHITMRDSQSSPNNLWQCVFSLFKNC